MKLLCVILTGVCVAYFALVNGCVEHPCETDRDCKWNECCVTKYTGERKICKDMGDDVGDVCGGRYFCSRCSRNLTCVPVINQGLDEYNCTFPANGTCLYESSIPVPSEPVSFEQVQPEPFLVPVENPEIPPMV